MTDLERAQEIVSQTNPDPLDLVHAIAAALAAVREADAQAVSGLIGKDNGCWNRAIAYAVDAIRKGEK